jgi:chromosomal replication initiator protein
MLSIAAQTQADRPAFHHKVSDPFVADVIATVAAEFGISEREMLVHSRDHRIWKPRMAAMYYCRLLTQCSLPELGRVFGGRSHTTVLRAFRRCREMIDSDEVWASHMDRLLVKLVEKIVSPR